MSMAFLLCSLSLSGQAKKSKHKRKKSKASHGYYTGKGPVVAPLQNADSPEFQRFLVKIKEMKSEKAGNVKVFIMGDSHMQCEDFGSSLKQYFSDSLAISYAGRGFAFPYSLARTTHRSDMIFGPNSGWAGCRFTKESNVCDWGLTGWTAHFEKDSTTFFWTNSKGDFVEGDEILVFCPDRCAYSYRLSMYDSSGTKQTMFYNPKKGAYEGRVLKTNQKLYFDLVRNSTGSDFVIQGLLRKPVKSGLICGISGTNGARIDHYLQNPDFQKHLTQLDPDLVIICLGTNEAFSTQFEPETGRSNISMLLSKIKIASPNTAVLLVGPPDHCIKKRKPNPKTEQLNLLFSQIADDLDFVFWNQQKSMGGKGSIFSWYRKGLATKDLVHFTPAGYKKQAFLLGAAIKPTLLKLN